MIALIALSVMAQLLVRNISDELVRALKLRAAGHGVSTEEEHRRILTKALTEPDRDTNGAMKRALMSLAERGQPTTRTIGSLIETILVTHECNVETKTCLTIDLFTKPEAYATAAGNS